MYLLSYEIEGHGTFIRAADREEVRRTIEAPAFRADGDALHVATFTPTRPLEPARGVHTTIEAIRAWTQGDLPIEVETSHLAEREAKPGRRNAFLRTMRRTLAAGVSEGVLDLAQAAAIARATTLAVIGVGPAGQRGRSQAFAILAQRGHR